MKAVVSCDEYCAQVRNLYYLRDFGLILVKRYLMVFDEVRLIVRTFQCSSINESGKYKNLIDDKRIEIVPMPFFQGPKQFLKNFNDIRNIVSESLKGCDLAILRLPSALGFAVWRQIIKDNIPYALELVYDCYDGYRQSTGMDRGIWWIMHRMQKSACKRAIGIAPVTSKYLQSHYTPTDKSIINSHYSSVEMDDDFFYKERKYPNKKIFTLVHVANQIEYRGRKGHEDVIRSIKKLRDEGFNVNVIFIGEDYNGGIQKLQQYAEAIDVCEYISFTGFLSSKEMREVLINSDIAILPTRAEGLPRVVIESMAMGLPCITTNVSGNPELIEDEFLFNYGDVNAIVRLIEMLISDKEKYEQASKVNYENSLGFSKRVLDKRRKDFFTDLRNRIEQKT